MTDGNSSAALAAVRRVGLLDAPCCRLHIAEKRRTSGTDLIAELAADTSENRLTDDEPIELCFLFVLAGPDTVTLSRPAVPRIPEYYPCLGASAWPDWPSGLTGIDSLPLIFPAEVHAAR